ncbi:MAG: hypothetical protein QXS43_11980 [Metallosphaera sp.]|uniref:hypothetical protein n=1 Tax=Metallosphaera sp. TaxID=2020860 RepID=UPI0031768EDB
MIRIEISKELSELKTLRKKYGMKDSPNESLGDYISAFNAEDSPRSQREVIKTILDVMQNYYQDALENGKKIDDKNLTERYKALVELYADLKAIESLSITLEGINERYSEKAVQLNIMLTMFEGEADDIIRSVANGIRKGELEEEVRQTLFDKIERPLENFYYIDKDRDLEKDIDILEDKLEMDLDITRGEYFVLKEVIDSLKIAFNDASTNTANAYDIMRYAANGDTIDVNNLDFKAILLYSVYALASFKTMEANYYIVNKRGYEVQDLETDLKNAMADAREIIASLL